MGKSSLSARSDLELRALREFRTIFASARRHDAQVRRLTRLSGSQLWALSEIGASRGIRVNELTNRLAVHQTTGSNIVNALVEKKLASRVRDARDQRAILLQITQAGERLLKRAPRPQTTLLVDALRKLRAPALRSLCISLTQLSKGIPGAAGDAARATSLVEQ